MTKKHPRIRRLTLTLMALLPAAISLPGCSLLRAGGSGNSSQLDVEVRHSPRAIFDAQTAQQSEALHSYLMGEILRDKRNLPGAIDNLAKASKLFSPSVPSLNAELAELYLRTQELEQALQQISGALDQEPQNPDYLLLKASLLQALKRSAESEAAFRELLALPGEHTEARLMLGLLLFQSERFEEAKVLFSEALTLQPHDGMLTYYLGRTQEALGNIDQALKLYEQTAAIEPRNPHALLDVIRLKAKLGDIGAIKARCEQLLQIDSSNQTAKRVLLYLSLQKENEAQALMDLASLSPTPITFASTRFRLALSAVRHQDQASAIRELRLVLAEQPDNAEARYNLAAVLSSSGNTPEAAGELFKVQEGDALFVKARTFAAFLLRQEKRYSEAEQAIRDALSVEEKDPQILGFLVIILKEAKKLDEARSILEQQLKINPSDDQLWFSYGTLMHDLNNPQGSLEAMEKVLALDPQNSDALNFVAFALAQQKKDLPRAAELIASALKIRPNDGYYLDTMGWILFQQGEFADAEATLSRAVQYSSEDPEILEHYGDALERVGKLADAKDIFRRALEKLRDSDDQDSPDLRERLEKKLSAPSA